MESLSLEVLRCVDVALGDMVGHDGDGLVVRFTGIGGLFQPE